MVAHDDVADGFTLDVWGDAAAGSFDFGEFGHVLLLCVLVEGCKFTGSLEW